MLALVKDFVVVEVSETAFTCGPEMSWYPVPIQQTVFPGFVFDSQTGTFIEGDYSFFLRQEAARGKT